MSACKGCHGSGADHGAPCLRCDSSGVEPLFCGAFRCQSPAKFLVKERYFCRTHFHELRAVTKEAGLSMPESEEIPR